MHSSIFDCSTLNEAYQACQARRLGEMMEEPEVEKKGATVII